MSRETIVNQSKQAFIDALIQLLATESFQNITVKQLLLESGYSRRTYYRYFGSKTAILDELFYQSLKNYRNYLLQQSLIPKEIPNLLITFLWPQRYTIKLLAQQNLLTPLISQHLSEIVANILAIKVSWRQDAPSNNPGYRYAITYSVGGFCMLLNQIFTNEHLDSPNQVSHKLENALNEIFEEFE